MAPAGGLDSQEWKDSLGSTGIVLRISLSKGAVIMSKKAVFSIVLVLGIVSCFVHWNALFRSADAKVETVSLQSKEQSQKQGANEAVENESSQDQRILREFIDGLGPAKSTTGITGVMGFVIDEIDPGSPAEIVGLKKGDVILNVDRHEVSSLKPIVVWPMRIKSSTDQMLKNLGAYL